MPKSQQSIAPPRRYDPTSPLAKLLGQCRRALVLTFILTLITETLSVAPILYMLNMFDRVMTSRSEVTLISLTVLVLGVYVLWSALDWVRSRLMVRISLRIDWDTAARSFDASFRRYAGRRKVDVHQVLGDLLQLRQFLTGSALIALMSAPFAVVFIAIGGVFHPYLAIFSLVSSLLLLAVSYSTQKVSDPALRAANQASAESNRIASESLRHAETALALGMQRDIRNRWYQRHKAYLQMQVNASEAAGLMGGVSGFLTKSLPSLQMALAMYLAIEGLITGGMVIAATFLISKAIAPMQKLLSSWKDISNARQSYERLDELLAEDDAKPERMQLPPPKGRLSVVDLTGVPPGATKPVIRGLTFDAEPGRITTIIGQSGAGKTSLLKLLVGIWAPARGSVRLDGAELSDWAHDEVGRYIGYVPQDIDFFEGTISENIARLGEVDAAKVVAAATLAGIHAEVLALPQGYETLLGPTGHALTGGMRQRLAIARALYGDPPYIAMDEPNASLDEAGESALVESLKALRSRGATVIVSTHRPSLIGIADYLLVLAEGTQKSYGPRDEVLEPIRKPAADAQPAPAAPRPGEVRIEVLPPQGPDQLVNAADTTGTCALDATGRVLQLKFEYAGLFRSADVAAFVLFDDASKAAAVLRPRRSDSPALGEKHPDIPWSGTSRFSFDEKVEASPGAASFSLGCLVETVDEAWYCAQYPDAAEGIRKGSIPSARYHFMRHGYAEGRKASATPGRLVKVATLRIAPPDPSR